MRLFYAGPGTAPTQQEGWKAPSPTKCKIKTCSPPDRYRHPLDVGDGNVRLMISIVIIGEAVAIVVDGPPVTPAGIEISRCVGVIISGVFVAPIITVDTLRQMGDMPVHGSRPDRRGAD
jgi:hypothetical protein